MKMSEESKICPISLAGDEGYYYCKGKLCKWYLEEFDDCLFSVVGKVIINKILEDSINEKLKENI